MPSMASGAFLLLLLLATTVQALQTPWYASEAQNQSSLYSPDPPGGGVWLFGMVARSPITSLWAYALNMSKPSTILGEHEIKLKYEQSLVPRSRDWAQDNVNGRLVMWHTILGSDACALEEVALMSHLRAPRLASSVEYSAKYCVKGAQLALTTAEPLSTYMVVRIEAQPLLVKFSGHTMKVVSSKIPTNVNGAIGINPFFPKLYIVNTTLLVSTQNVVTVSTITGDVTVDLRPIATDAPRLKAIALNPKKLGQGMASAGYNEQSGRIARLNIDTAPWTVTKLGYTPFNFEFRFDWDSEPMTAYACSGSSSYWYDLEKTNPALSTCVVGGKTFTRTMIIPYNM